MIAEDPEALVEEESPLIASAPAHVRLTQKQRSTLIFLAFAVPLWIILGLLMTLSYSLTLAFVGGLLLLVVIYGVGTEYLLFAWFALFEYSIILKLLGVGLGGLGVKGLFFAAVLSQLPNKFALMPRRLFRTVPARWPLYVFFIWVGISTFWSDYPVYGIRLFVRWLMGFFFYAILFLSINDRNKRLFFVVFAIVVGSSVLFGFLQWLGLGIPLQDVEMFRGYEMGVEGGAVLYRVTGFSGHPNGLGRECVFEFCVLLMMLISWRPSPFWRIVILGMMGLSLGVIVLTYSRVGWVLLAVGGGTFILLTKPRLLIPMTFVAGLIAIVAWPQIWARLEPVLSGTDASLAVRGVASRVYMEQWKLQPLTGYGLGSTGGGALYKIGLAPHEGYVFLLSYFGLVGLVLYVAVVLAMLRNSIRVFRNGLVRADNELHVMAALGLSCTATLALEFTLGIGLYMWRWYLLAASFSAVRIARQRNALASSQAPANQLPS